MPSPTHIPSTILRHTLGTMIGLLNEFNVLATLFPRKVSFHFEIPEQISWYCAARLLVNKRWTEPCCVRVWLCVYHRMSMIVRALIMQMTCHAGKGVRLISKVLARTITINPSKVGKVLGTRLLPIWGFMINSLIRIGVLTHNVAILKIKSHLRCLVYFWYPALKSSLSYILLMQR